MGWYERLKGLFTKNRTKQAPPVLRPSEQDDEDEDEEITELIAIDIL